MNTTVLKFSESDAFLKSISIKTIKDVRALDVDLLLILVNGDRIIISNGAMQALNAPDMALQFSDGQLPLARVFQQIERIEVSPEANLTVSSKEITRYNQNNARVKKHQKEDEDGDKPVILEEGERDPSAASATTGIGGNTDQPNFSPMRAADHQQQIADAEVNSDKEKDKNWGVQWPIAAGALALLAAAGGGGGGGGGGNNGSGGNAGNGSTGATGANGGHAGVGNGSVEPPLTSLSGTAALGPIKNANITAYDQLGNALSATTEVVDGKYNLVLNKPFYKGAMLLVTFDSTAASTNSFTLQAAPNLLAPGFYRDLTATVTNVTEGSIHNGQTSVIKDVGLGWYWAAQSMGDLSGGSGSDGLLLSATPSGTSPTVTTGDGADTLTVGAFGKTGNFSATVTDFKLGLDKVQVFGQTVTAANFASFATRAAATADGLGTTLVVDLDGAGAGSQTYTLNLQNLKYVAANTQTIFGV